MKADAKLALDAIGVSCYQFFHPTDARERGGVIWLFVVIRFGPVMGSVSSRIDDHGNDAKFIFDPKAKDIIVTVGIHGVREGHTLQ